MGENPCSPAAASLYASFVWRSMIQSSGSCGRSERRRHSRWQRGRDAGGGKTERASALRGVGRGTPRISRLLIYDNEATYKSPFSSGTLESGDFKVRR